jgi:hypothetical protein
LKRRDEVMSALAAARPSTALQWLRYGGNIANLSTPLGLLIAAIGRAEVRSGPRGLLLAESYRLPFPIAGAFTVGNVVTTGSTWEAILSRYPKLLEHEERHTWQYLYCLGLPYFGLYAAAMAWSVLRTGDRAAANFFERQAGLDLGGYRELPPRPIPVGLASVLEQARQFLRSRS